MSKYLYLISIYAIIAYITKEILYMDIRVMENYLAVVREGNISAAAQALHVSQPALSRQMRDLEEELGVTLFERGSRRIRLTEEGMILRRPAVLRSGIGRYAHSHCLQPDLQCLPLRGG